MRVDILISGNSPGGERAWAPLTKTLLQNIEVLSAGRTSRRMPKANRSRCRWSICW